jgi:cyclopropane fatty-acyl-phospholipid synthase-like methyltransferase
LRLLILVLAITVVPACRDSRASSQHEPTPEEMAAYDRYRRPDLLVAALDLHTGDSVADIGAGEGYLEPYLARAVGLGGHVLATDIDAAALARIDATPPIVTRVVPSDDPQLEAGAYDVILLAETDHLLAERASYFRKLVSALKPGGRVAVTNRMSFRRAVIEAATAAGYTIASESHDLPGHFLVLLTPGAPR